MPSTNQSRYQQRLHNDLYQVERQKGANELSLMQNKQARAEHVATWEEFKRTNKPESLSASDRSEAKRFPLTLAAIALVDLTLTWTVANFYLQPLGLSGWTLVFASILFSILILLSELGVSYWFHESQKRLREEMQSMFSSLSTYLAALTSFLVPGLFAAVFGSSYSDLLNHWYGVVLLISSVGLIFSIHAFAIFSPTIHAAQSNLAILLEQNKFIRGHRRLQEEYYNLCRVQSDLEASKKHILRKLNYRENYSQMNVPEESTTSYDSPSKSSPLAYDHDASFAEESESDLQGLNLVPPQFV